MSRKLRSWLLRRFGALAILWSVLAEGSTFQWWFGLMVVVVATAASYILSYDEQNTKSLNLVALFVFLPYFFYQSYKGGARVAWAAFSPRKVLRPYLMKFPFRIRPEDELARVTVAAVLCLFPGTVSCRIENDYLLMHVLDEGMFDMDETRKVERLIANIFSADLSQAAVRE
ncbi:Na+/H+ antiporter subunit E [Oligoflexus tunisiensis]|uniref:Na+/H+ antiporter subunit E n=1 Tax=Oligoflexus tunisiensis TaxID=708132 RepID=UPI000B1B471A|nr:Na+/H+ antiporter subunit E [Oligoflexus tunisiensis]